MMDREQSRWRLSCQCGHRARLYQRTGNRTRAYFVECSRCSLRTPAAMSARAAAHDWHHNRVQSIRDWTAPTAGPIPHKGPHTSATILQLSRNP